MSSFNVFHRISIVIVLGIAFQVFVGRGEPLQPEIQVWVENPMVCIHPDTPPGSVSTIEIGGARNEVEPFQVVIRSQTRKLEGVTASISDLKNVSGSKINKASIILYREQFHYIHHPSPHSSDSPDIWPDALIPFIDPWDGHSHPEMQLVRQEQEGKNVRKLVGARFSGSPFAVWPENCQPLWIDVAIPKDAVPGDYAGKFTVAIPGFDSIELPVKLTVWDFVLPEGAPLATHFGSLEKIASKHHVQPGTPEYAQLYERYATSLAEHRIDPPIPEYLVPPVKLDGTIDWKPAHEKLKSYITRHQLRTFQIPAFPWPDPLETNRKISIRYLESYYDYLQAQGWEKEAYYFPFDEPNSKQEYALVRAYAKLVHEAHPKIKVLCTEQPYPQDATWGTLEGAVDIWCPMFAFYNEASARKVLQRGNELWSYTALCQMAPPYHPEYASVVGQPTLFWQIDFPPLNFRLPLWMNWRNGITGLLYWSTVSWDGPERDVWTDPAFRNRYNGEGFLFYPGRDAEIQGPVASIRLKMLREGMEDYCYFSLLARLGGKEFLNSEVRKITSSWWKWDNDPDHLYPVRAAIAAKIMELQQKKK